MTTEKIIVLTMLILASVSWCIVGYYLGFKKGRDKCYETLSKAMKEYNSRKEEEEQ